MTIETALRDLDNAVQDLQSSDHNTYDRPLKYLAAILASDELKPIVDDLKAEVDLEEFITEANAGATRIGSARLNWPTNKNEVLGLSIAMIEFFAEDLELFENFAFTYYYSGNNISKSVQNLVKSVIIPFNRDFAIHVKENLPNTNHE